METLKLPTPDGQLVDHRMQGAPQSHQRPQSPLRSRRIFAAAHVVADPFADNAPGVSAGIDWEATLQFRHHLWSWGLAVADAMDTAQRGMGLDWPNIQTLVRSSCAEAARVGGAIACGANTDQIEGSTASLEQIVEAYLEQVALVEGAGGQVVLMASRHLAEAATSSDDYHEVYRRVLSHTTRPAIVHWLGPMFDPALEGYWGAAEIDKATDHFLDILAENSEHVDGVKISLLAKDREVDMRRRLPAGLNMYTGDDFAYSETMLGDEHGYSHAFLGAFDLVAPAASAAVQALDADRREEFSEILDGTLPLARHVFSSPTYYYKCGVVFMAYLNGHQSHFRMVHGLESTRSVLHLTRQFRLADEAGLFDDPDLAGHRMRRFLALAGVE
jgi:Protein of unknown function (DUF993)